MSSEELIPATDLVELQTLIDRQDDLLLMPSRFPDLLFRCLVRDLYEFQDAMAAMGATSESLARALALPALRGPLMVLRGTWMIISSEEDSFDGYLQLSDLDLLHGLSVLKSFWVEENYIRFEMRKIMGGTDTVRRVQQEAEYMFVIRRMVAEQQGTLMLCFETPSAASFTKHVWSPNLKPLLTLGAI